MSKDVNTFHSSSRGEELCEMNRGIHSSRQCLCTNLKGKYLEVRIPLNTWSWAGLCDCFWPIGCENRCIKTPWTVPFSTFPSLPQEGRKWTLSDGAVTGRQSHHQTVLLNHRLQNQSTLEGYSDLEQRALLIFCSFLSSQQILTVFTDTHTQKDLFLYPI